MVCPVENTAAEIEYKLRGIVLEVSMYLGPQQIWRMSLFPCLQAEVAIYEGSKRHRIIAYLRTGKFEEESLIL